MANNQYKIVYVTPALYMAGGVERVLTLKANYFAEQFGYDITIVLTEGKDKPYFYQLSPKVKVINLDLNFEELWTCSFLKKILVYLPKQRRFKKLLTNELMHIRPDITISLLRRDINFITSIKDGSINFVKHIFEKYWMKSLISHLIKLDKFVVLTHEDRVAWPELKNVEVIPDPLSFVPDRISPLTSKRIIAVGRYHYQKGFDLLLRAWKLIETKCPDWQLAIYGQGNKEPYMQLAHDLGLDMLRCHLYDPTSNIQQEYVNSSIFVFSSRYEGFGMVLVEAMACGLPVVSYACPCGPRDIISDGIDGFLVEKEDINALAHQLLLLINDEQERQAMSLAAQHKAATYHMDHIADRWQSLFEEFLK